MLADMSMARVKELSLPGVSQRYWKSADVLLVLDNGVAIRCHSQILSLHSAVFCNMLEDLGSQHNPKTPLPHFTEIPLPHFTEVECSAVLTDLYRHGASSSCGALQHSAQGAAIAVGRFAHTYDAPLALQRVQVYLRALMSARFRSKDSAELTGETCDEHVLAWAVMADKYDLHQLCGHCERAMVMHWDHFQDKTKLIDQLSSGALQRVAKGLSATVSANYGRICSIQKYPSVEHFITWRQQKQ